jgi:predicted naringenin-chalcone synthase
LGTALPENRYRQEEIAFFMKDYLQLSDLEFHSLQKLYKATGIHYRHSVLPDFGKAAPRLFKKEMKEPGVQERMILYKEFALPLAQRACEEAIEKARIAHDTITHIITVSCTGMYAPGIDIELVKALGLSTSINRTSVNFMGCYAAFNALKLADSICRADQKANVLVVCVELCSLHFQRKATRDQVVAHSLFADGAAAAILSAAPNDDSIFQVLDFHCELIPSNETAMAWEIGEHAFDMVLSSYIPELVEQGMSDLVASLLDKSTINNSVQQYAIHPGGRKILEAVTQSLNLPEEALSASYRVLRENGNMSSPTVLFVLNDLPSQETGKTILSAAFGPGLTMESMILKSI